MWPVLPAPVTALVVLAMLGVALFAVRVLQPAWWRVRAVRLAVRGAFVLLVFAIAVWCFGRAMHDRELVQLGAGAAYVGVLVLGPAVALLPFGAALDRLGRTRVQARSPQDAPAKLSRRALFRAGGAAMPALGALTGASGFAAAKAPPRMPVVRMAFEGLHPDLHGLRILQISDVHLGASFDTGDLARGLEAVFAAHRPDLVVLTGDLADDVRLVAPALELVAKANARYGALASLGNHEYLNGIAGMRAAYEASPVPLLVSAGRTLRIGGARLFVGGADDPRQMGGDIAAKLTPSIVRAAADAPAEADFRLLLCHRPEGFAPAVANGFDLVLAGHTHGGQLGLFGRSLLELVKPDTDWWGRYERARPASPAAQRSKLAASPARLYTTSGFGHWFPFRLGCPTEMPIVVLERAGVEDGGRRPARRV